jgi:putative oxidoreductase
VGFNTETNDMKTNSLPSSNAANPSDNPAQKLLALLLRTEDLLPPVILRLTLAVVMFPHGAQKLLGWYGGHGFEGTMGFFTGTMGIPAVFAFGAIMVEFFGPILLVLGAATRVTAFSLGVVMAVAMFMVHVQHGFFMNWFGNQKGEGMEYFLLFLGAALALVISGGGRWSLDRLSPTR